MRSGQRVAIIDASFTRAMTPLDLFDHALDHHASPARSHVRAGGRIASVNISAGGVPKLPVGGARLTTAGLEGDKQRNKRLHGGSLRALCLYSLERIRALQAEGHPIVPGSTGENITLEGIDWDLLVPGVRLALGDAEIEVLSFTEPCGVIRRSFSDYVPFRIGQDEHPGWSRVYARVIKEGTLRVGDSAQLLPATDAAG